MDTLLLHSITPDDVASAARILRRGGLVAFPTETVYGLGAIASNEAAVQQIFAVKGRPSGVPLILHVANLEMASRYVQRVDPRAALLANKFWPGPLTFVLRRAQQVSLVVTGGGETVAVRAPAHPAAMALIDAAGEGIAAPSANRHGDLPPVRAEQVFQGLGGAIDAVLDGGRSPGGLESTVLDLTQSTARVLRRGAVSIAALRAWIIVEDAPHAPPAPVELQGAWLSAVRAAAIATAILPDERTGLLLRTVSRSIANGTSGVVARGMPLDPEGYASELYDALHELQADGCTRVMVEALPEEGEWDAVRDRVARLARG